MIRSNISKVFWKLNYLHILEQIGGSMVKHDIQDKIVFLIKCCLFPSV